MRQVSGKHLQGQGKWVCYVKASGRLLKCLMNQHAFCVKSGPNRVDPAQPSKDLQRKHRRKMLHQQTQHKYTRCLGTVCATIALTCSDQQTNPTDLADLLLIRLWIMSDVNSGSHWEVEKKAFDHMPPHRCP